VRSLVCTLILFLLLTACNRAPDQPPQVGRLLVHDPNSREILWIEGGKRGATVAGNSERAAVCALNAAPDGKQAVLYSGTAAEGTYYLVLPSENAMAIQLATGAPMGCEIAGRTAFSDNGKTLALLVYPTGAGLGAEYATGTLRLFDAATGKAIREFPDIHAYQWANDALNFVTFRGAAGAITATVTLWQPGTDQQTTYPVPAAAEGCSLVNVQAVRQGEAIFASVGERCINPTSYFATLYQLTADKATALSERKSAGGKFYPATASHTLFALRDGKMLVWIIPDGRSVETGTLWRWDTSTRQGESLALFTVTDQSPLTTGRRFAPDPMRDQLAYIQLNPQGGETLWMWELSRPQTEPAQINDMIRSDKIPALAWSSDGARLGYLFSSTSKSSLSYIDKRGVRRDAVMGIFQSLALSATGEYAYTAQQAANGYTLHQIRLQDGAMTPLITGATLPIVPLFAP
jgi:hypothetical protein